MSFIVNLTNTSGDTGTVNPDAGFTYTDKLNQINQGVFNFSGVGLIKRGLLEVGSKIEVLRNSVREFYGLVNDINYLSGGGVVVNASGFEIWLAMENGAYAGSPWTATASATIASAIIAESTKFTAGTINAGSTIDFRLDRTDSLYVGLSNLVRKTQQDIGIDYPNLKIDVLNHKGIPTPAIVLNAGIEISNVRVNKIYPTGNIIIVIGSSEGETKITATAEDVASKATYGNITMTIRDRTISTTAEAQKLADAELALRKDPIEVYDFEVINDGLDIFSGDVITLNATSQEISNKNARVVGIERGVIGSEEFLTLQVTNEEFSKLVIRRNESIAEIEKNTRQGEAYNQYNSEYSNRIVDTTIAGVIDVGVGSGAVGLAPINTNTDFWFLTGGSGDIYLSPGTSGQVLITGLVGMHMGNNPIVSVEDPTSAQDAATKNYVDSRLSTALYTANSVLNLPSTGSKTIGTLTLNGVKANQGVLLLITFSYNVGTNPGGAAFWFTRAGSQIGPAWLHDQEGEDVNAITLHYIDFPLSDGNYAYTLEGQGQWSATDDVFDIVFSATKL